MRIIDYRTTKFVMIPQSLARDTSLKPTDKVVYMTLCLYANNTTKRAHPNADTIAEVSGVSRNTVFRALKALEDGDYIKRKRRASGGGKRISNDYYLLDK